MIPEFIIDKVYHQILMTDKSLKFGLLKDRFSVLYECIKNYLENIDEGFVSNNSKEFIDYLEDHVGKIIITGSFAIRIRKGSVRLFVNGKEILK